MSYKGDNAGYHGDALPVLATTQANEMEAFDRLGPLTKKAFREVSFKFTALVWTKFCEARGYDPCHPMLDKQIADTLYRDNEIGIRSDPQCKL